MAAKAGKATPNDTPGRRGVVVRKDGRQLKRLCLYFPAVLARDLAIYCATTDRDASAVVSEVVESFIASVGKK